MQQQRQPSAGTSCLTTFIFLIAIMALLGSCASLFGK